MNEKSQLIETVPEFLAHAVELEDESVERYKTLADSMEVHHNDEVAKLFRQQMQYSEQHADEVRQLSQDIPLPEIPPWDFKWSCPGSPEGDCMEDEVNYLMTVNQAVELALHNESRGRDFYLKVAKESPDSEVRRLSAEMAQEEQEHVDTLQDWLDRQETAAEPPQDDLDPPNMPE